MRRKCAHCGKRIGADKRSDAVYCKKSCSGSAKFQRQFAVTPAKFLNRSRAYNATCQESRLLTNARYRAKKSGLPFSIAVDDISIPDVCPVLGIPIQRHTGRCGGGNSSPSLDRIVPALGYVRGNVRVISYRANLLKSDATIEELQAVLSDSKRLHCST